MDKIQIKADLSLSVVVAVNPLPLMVSTGVLGFVSSEPFTGIGSDYLFGLEP